MKRILAGFYKHYSGSYYKVIGVGTHIQTLEKFVVSHDSNNKIWIHPEKSFVKNVINKKCFAFKRNLKLKTLN